MPQTPSASSRTSLNQEMQKQKLWRLRPHYKGITIFNSLLHNEFLSLEEQEARQQQALQQMLKFCFKKVPYYKQLFRDLGLSRSDFNSLENFRKIPLLTKSMVQEFLDELYARKLPPGHVARGVTKTSGTTGQPVEIQHTEFSAAMFLALKQREYRWFGWDPRLVMAAIRPAKDLPPNADGELIKLGETSRIEAWQRVGDYFETAPFYGFQRANPIEEQKKWLAAIEPAYLIAQPADLEMLALAYRGEKTPASFRGFLAVAQEMTEEMQLSIENTFKAPIQINYGLNEVGLNASHCPEGGRYHVHAEHCYLEIVNEEGRPCQTGERGRILVSSLNNLAMPLLRYDTDDLGEAVEGPCPCGRSLPSFGRIHGRYRRLVSLPDGVMNYFICLQHTLGKLAAEHLKNLRQYQLHHFENGDFELRIVISAPMAPAFQEKIMEKWLHVVPQNPARLRIVEVADIPRPPGGKYQNFTSDCMPVPTPADQ